MSSSRQVYLKKTKNLRWECSEDFVSFIMFNPLKLVGKELERIISRLWRDGASRRSEGDVWLDDATREQYSTAMCMYKEERRASGFCMKRSQ